MTVPRLVAERQREPRDRSQWTSSRGPDGPPGGDAGYAFCERGLNKVKARRSVLRLPLRGGKTIERSMRDFQVFVTDDR
jgi:hypothetical protein